MRINNRLKAVLKTAGVTHDDLAKSAGISTRQVTRILAGDSAPSAETIERWCASQGLDPSVAMAESPSMLDMVVIMMGGLTKDEMSFVCKLVSQMYSVEIDRDSS